MSHQIRGGESKKEARLFVGQLPQNVTSEEIEEYFSSFGTIINVFIPNSTKSKRIAFVTFQSTKGVYNVMTKQQHDFRGHEIHVSMALPKGQPPPRGGLFKKAESTRIFVNGIPPTADDDGLKRYFSEFGSVIDVHYTNPRSFGFVTFSSESEMFACLAAGPHIYDDAELKTEVAKPKPAASFRPNAPGIPQSFDMGNPLMTYGNQTPYANQTPYTTTNKRTVKNEGPNCRLFIGGMMLGTTEEELREHFGQFGEIIDFFRPSGSTTGKTGGYAFITYSKTQEMFTALAAGVHIVKDTELRVMEAAPKPKAGQQPAPRNNNLNKEHRVFVGRIPVDITDDDIRSHFSEYGIVTDCYRPRNQRASKLGHEFGFVIFQTETDMAKALSQASHVINGNELTVTRARARPGKPKGSGPDMAALAFNNYSSGGMFPGGMIPTVGALTQAQYGQQAMYNPYLGGGPTVGVFPQNSNANYNALETYGASSVGNTGIATGSSRSQKPTDRRYHPY